MGSTQETCYKGKIHTGHHIFKGINLIWRNRPNQSNFSGNRRGRGEWDSGYVRIGEEKSERKDMGEKTFLVRIVDIGEQSGHRNF